MTGRRGEEGVGVVLVIGIVVLLMTVALIGARAVALIATHRQVQAAADLAALAGVEAELAGREPCLQADRIAIANGADLTRCAASHGVVDVVVDVVVEAGVGLLGTWTLSGRARAGSAP